jgi:two-component system chemotaxis response regulator CheB
VVESRAIDLVVIGASTGGPPALQRVFQETPLLEVPFVVAQHMPPTFTRLFAERIDKLSRYRVREAVHGEVLEPGTVHVAPGGQQTEIVETPEGLRISVGRARDGDLYAPSVNRLFSSASRACGKRLLAIVLTGMGDDGATGTREVRERGGRTIAEDRSSAIIFGMPGEAIRTGSVDEVLALEEIPTAIGRLCSGC